MTVAALFVRSDSIYKTMPGVDAWDIERDARKWPGGSSCVVHPPCRSWGRLRQFAQPRNDEKALGPWAVEQVRQWGGVLEHPQESTLFAHCGMPRPGQFPDAWGGWTMVIDQFHFGHRAEKRTWLYIVGCEPDDLPPIPVTDVLVYPRPTDYCCEGHVNMKGQWTYSEYEPYNGVVQYRINPSHWMPLPPPPAQLARAADDGGKE